MGEDGEGGGRQYKGGKMRGEEQREAKGQSLEFGELSALCGGSSLSYLSNYLLDSIYQSVKSFPWFSVLPPKEEEKRVTK